MQDIQIIQKCLKNDRVAQKQLYHLHADFVMNIARRYAKDISEGKDIVQNTFIKIFKSLDRYDPNRGKFQHWISRITVNEAIAIKRKNINWQVTEFPERDSKEIINNEAIADLNYKDMIKSMDRLPEQHRLILQMFYVDDLDHKEIASIINIKESSSRSRLSRARKLFIEQLKYAKAI